MAYMCELGSGQRIYLDNVGEQTTITLVSESMGQQQQSGSQFTTGAWTAPPEMLHTEQGIVLQLTTAQGRHHLQIQGSQVGWMSNAPALNNAQQMQVSAVSAMPGNNIPSMQPMESMQPMQPMQPMGSMQPMQPMQSMQPMKMGNMEMGMQPMQMRMGNMEMRMGDATTKATKPKFCSQCGAPVKPSDRFCANCGHQLSA